jgi:threonine synthase
MITPQNEEPKLAEALGIEKIYLKREDLHPLESHKGRSIPLIIDSYISSGHTNFVISSSGNAALATGIYIKQLNESENDKYGLTILVGEKIDEEKFNHLVAKLTSYKITIKKVNRPRQQAFQMNKSGEAKLIRQSIDDLALIGYEELAEEISEIENIHAIFIPTSSGTTVQGLFVGFGKVNQSPELHIVQTTACHPLADAYDNDFFASENSIAGAIVDKVAHRKKEVTEAISQSGGSGWVVSDEQILESIKLIKNTCDIDISSNSALSIAGLKKALDKGWKPTGVVVCLITGK